MAFSKPEALERLTASIDAGRLAHAYLVCGPEGSGKRDLVHTLSERLLSVPRADFEKNPDYHTIAPESRSRRILIDQMRELEKAMRERAVSGPRKVAVIFDADRMQPQAANAFLKTLEEPPAGSHFFLISSLPGALMDTIVSRCLPVHLMAGSAAPMDPAEAGLVESFREALNPGILPETAGLQFARAFSELLGRERDAIRGGFEADFKAEQAHYKQTTDGKWLEDREDQLKAGAEAAVVRRRGELIQIVYREISRGLLASTTGADAGDSAQTRAWLRCAAALDALSDDLQRGVYESLAIEAGFLNLFHNRPTCASS